MPVATPPLSAQRASFAEVAALSIDAADPAEILAVHGALDRLRALHPRQAQIIELRYFVGLDEQEVAELLDLSRATVSRDWRVGRLLLGRLLSADDPAS